METSLLFCCRTKELTTQYYFMLWTRAIFLLAAVIAAVAALDSFPLQGMHYQTFDPFLFCAFHHDHYPPSDGAYGVPRHHLRGREVGSDFSQRDGWSMYHGTSVPGFPAHPHRGFETVTVVVQGKVDHADSNGNTVRYGDGDVQWMTAGRGLQHSEMFPLMNKQSTNELVLFQIWLNLPKKSKMVAPQYVVFPSAEIPKTTSPCSQVTVIAGAWHDTTPSWLPPVDSWGYEQGNEVGVWLLETTEACEISLPATMYTDTQRTMYLYDNNGMVWFDDVQVLGTRGVRLPAGKAMAFKTAGATKALILQGRPIGEPVAQRGPMVMNTHQELQQAFTDYQRTQFGGWPWPRHDVVLPGTPTREVGDEL